MLDALDEAILAVLKADARVSFRQIAIRVGSTTPTVAKRIRRMEDARIIQGYTVVLDDSAFSHGGVPGSATGLVRVACHQCAQRTASPVWWRGDGREHPFCCPTCRAAFVERHELVAQRL